MQASQTGSEQTRQVLAVWAFGLCRDSAHLITLLAFRFSQYRVLCWPISREARFSRPWSRKPCNTARYTELILERLMTSPRPRQEAKASTTGYTQRRSSSATIDIKHKTSQDKVSEHEGNNGKFGLFQDSINRMSQDLIARMNGYYGPVPLERFRDCFVQIVPCEELVSSEIPVGKLPRTCSLGSGY